jgi:hypothetical protein
MVEEKKEEKKETKTLERKPDEPPREMGKENVRPGQPGPPGQTGQQGTPSGGPPIRDERREREMRNVQPSGDRPIGELEHEGKEKHEREKKEVGETTE